MAKKSKADRWSHAAGEAEAAADRIVQSIADENKDEINKDLGLVGNNLQTIEDIRQEYEDWYDAMSEGWQNGEKGQAVENIKDTDVQSVIDACDDLKELMNAEVINWTDVTVSADNLSDLCQELNAAEMP